MDDTTVSLMESMPRYRGRLITLTALAVLLLMAIPTGSCTAMQEGDEYSSTLSLYRIGVSAGFNTFALGDVKRFYQGLLDIYRGRDVPIMTQREFPGNLVIGARIMRNIPSFAEVGIGSRYSWTRAFSSYEDFAGTIESNAKVSMLSVEGIIQHSFSSNEYVNMYIGLQGGIVFGWSSYTQDVVFHDSPEQNGKVDLSGSGTGFTVDALVGGEHDLGNYSIGASLGYRYSKISEMDAELTGDGGAPTSGKLKLEHDLSGVIISIHFDFHL